LYSFWKMSTACLVEAAGMPMPSASSFACASVRPTSGSANTLMIFSGVACATSSMSMPPSLEAIMATFWLARSVTTET
jgi:hypothetical protein